VNKIIFWHPRRNHGQFTHQQARDRSQKWDASPLTLAYTEAPVEKRGEESFLKFLFKTIDNYKKIL